MILAVFVQLIGDDPIDFIARQIQQAGPHVDKGFGEVFGIVQNDSLNHFQQRIQLFFPRGAGLEKTPHQGFTFGGVQIIFCHVGVHLTDIAETVDGNFLLEFPVKLLQILFHHAGLLIKLYHRIFKVGIKKIFPHPIFGKGHDILLNRLVWVQSAHIQWLEQLIEKLAGQSESFSGSDRVGNLCFESGDALMQCAGDTRLGFAQLVNQGLQSARIAVAVKFLIGNMGKSALFQAIAQRHILEQAVVKGNRNLREGFFCQRDTAFLNAHDFLPGLQLRDRSGTFHHRQPMTEKGIYHLQCNFPVRAFFDRIGNGIFPVVIKSRQPGIVLLFSLLSSDADVVGKNQHGSGNSIQLRHSYRSAAVLTVSENDRAVVFIMFSQIRPNLMGDFLVSDGIVQQDNCHSLARVYN